MSDLSTPSIISAKPNGNMKSLHANGAINADSHKMLLLEHKNLRLQFNNVCYTIKQNRTKSKKILTDTSGQLRSGCLTAILGPSGAGKTSMLNVLSGFKAKGVSGEFLLNDKERNLLEFRKMSSYIPQDFALLDLLTVQETLKVSADLKLTKETTNSIQKLRIVDDIIALLNMDKCRHTYVRDLSGGERKRLSIGVELVTNPPVMFFDEPTSGLDSVSSYQVVKYLQKLANEGRIVVCVVHQPSSRLMGLFDDVLVMSRGEVLFCGAQADMLPVLKKANFICPNYYNPGDFVLEVGSEEPSDNTAQLIQRNKEKYSKNEQEKLSNNHITDESSKMLQTSSINHTSIELQNISDITEPSYCYSDTVRPKTRVNFNKQLIVLICRSVRVLTRNYIAVQLRVLMHILVGVLLGIVFWDVGNDGAKVLTNASCMIFLVMFVFFGNSMPSVLLCPQDTAVFVREYLNGWYSISAYYISKIISDLPLQFVCPTVFIAIVYFMTGQPYDLGRFVMCWGIMLLTGIIGHFIGLVSGSIFELQVAIFMIPALTIPLLVFSGFFIRINELAAYLRPFCDFSFFRYVVEGLLQAIYGYERPVLDCNIEFCFFRSPKKFLHELNMEGDLYGTDILVLFIWALAMIVLFFLSLIWRIKRAQ